jgi:hypothetical protein
MKVPLPLAHEAVARAFLHDPAAFHVWLVQEVLPPQALRRQDLYTSASRT